MDRRKVAKLRRELESLRAGKYNLKPSDLESMAKKVGRFRDTKRGKEPTYVSIVPGVRPLSIPGHPTINPHTANSILDVLEADIDRWEDSIDNEEKKVAEEKKQYEERKELPRQTIREDDDSNDA